MWVSKKAPTLKQMNTTWGKKAGKSSLVRVEMVIIVVMEAAITLDLLVPFQCQSCHGGANVRLFGQGGVVTFGVVEKVAGHVRPVLTP